MPDKIYTYEEYKYKCYKNNTIPDKREETGEFVHETSEEKAVPIKDSGIYKFFSNGNEFISKETLNIALNKLRDENFKELATIFEIYGDKISEDVFTSLFHKWL